MSGLWSPVQDGDTIRVTDTSAGHATVTLPDGNVLEGPAALLWDLFHAAACDLETIHTRQEASTAEKAPAPLPYVGNGPCAFCGHPDVGHRVRDAMAERFHAGDSLESIAFDYDLTVDVVERLIDMSERDDWNPDR